LARVLLRVHSFEAHLRELAGASCREGAACRALFDVAEQWCSALVIYGQIQVDRAVNTA
jgi:hypothetical protein